MNFRTASCPKASDWQSKTTVLDIEKLLQFRERAQIKKAMLRHSHFGIRSCAQNRPQCQCRFAGCPKRVSLFFMSLPPAFYSASSHKILHHKRTPNSPSKIVRQMTFREAPVARAIRWETSHPFLSFCRLPCSDRRSWDGRALCDVVEMFARLPNDVVKS